MLTATQRKSIPILLPLTSASLFNQSIAQLNGNTWIADLFKSLVYKDRFLNGNMQNIKDPYPLMSVPILA